METKRGDIFFANLGDSETNIGSEQSGMRPVLIIQNDIGNRYSPTVIVACMTSRIYKTEIPTHIKINSYDYELSGDSLILCEQIKTIDKTRLRNYLTSLKPSDQAKVDAALRLSLSI